MGSTSLRWLLSLLLGASLVLMASVITFCREISPVASGTANRNKNPVVAGDPFEPVKVLVDNTVARERRGEPVSVGIPLKRESGVVDTGSLCLTDTEGAAVPAQFRVLARWGALEDQLKPIRWVLADFQADVPPSATRTYLLTRARQPALAPLAVRDNGKVVTVDTGRMVFSVGKEGTGLFRELSLPGGPAFVDPAGFNGFLITRKEESFHGTVKSVTVEESGPLKVTLCIRGAFATAKGDPLVGGDAREAGVKPEKYPLSYTVRLSAYRNKSQIRLDYTLENNGRGISPYYPINDLFLDGSYFQLTPRSTRGVVSGVSFAEHVTPADTFILRQGYTLIDKKNEKDNFSYAATLNGRVLVSGARSDGWVDVTTGPVGVSLGLRYFWQNFPKSMEYDKGVIRVGLLPEQGAVPERDPALTTYATGNYFFNGGWHKSHELLLYLHDDATRSDAGQALQGLTGPLIPHCQPAWYAATRAWGLVAPADMSLPGDIGEAVALYEEYQKILVTPGRSTPDITRLRETRNQGLTHYGWENFGDLAWSGVFSGLHYDWPYIMWLQFIRSGDGAFYDMAHQMTEHSADLDQIHNDKPGTANGLWQWEKILSHGHHKSGVTAGFIVSHTWNGGYALGYLLTGNRRYLDAAERGVKAGRWYWEKAIAGKKTVYTENRSQGWTIEMMLNLYRITGDRKLLTDAMALFTTTLLYTERLDTPPGSGGKGYITYSDNSVKNKVIVTFASYPLEPLCALHYEAKNAGLDVTELEGFLVRNLTWLKQYAFVGGTWQGGGYSYLTLSYITDPLNPEKNNGGELAHNIHLAGAFGYGSLMLRESNSKLSQEFLLFGRQLFRDLMFYRTQNNKEKTAFHNPDVRSPVSWGWLPTATKELGWIGRGGQYYLWAEQNPPDASPVR